MRVSPVAHWYEYIDEVLDAAAATSLPTHNHDEGIKGAQTVALAIFRAEMKTPIICAIGHVGEELFLKSIADKVAPTPNGLGQYFSEMVERMTAKRNNSRAALVEEVHKQFVKQIEEANKKN